nr:MAG TPA: glutathione synthetase [Caudoviricetes sp.]
MKVLIACEESQRVCIAFMERGHEAYSCDIQDCSGGHPECRRARLARGKIHTVAAARYAQKHFPE